jgi:Tfp pilus assembly protein PilF
LAQQDKSGAEVDLDQAIALDARCGPAFVIRAGLKEDRGDVQGSIDDLTEALKIGTSDDRVVIRRGFNYLHTGSLDRAMDDFEEGLRLHPRSAEAHFGKALVRSQHGDPNRALEDVDMGLECCLPGDSLRDRLTELREKLRDA